jgi:hypothetical protein
VAVNGGILKVQFISAMAPPQSPVGQSIANSLGL